MTTLDLYNITLSIFDKDLQNLYLINNVYVGLELSLKHKKVVENNILELSFSINKRFVLKLNLQIIIVLLISGNLLAIKFHSNRS